VSVSQSWSSRLQADLPRHSNCAKPFPLFPDGKGLLSLPAVLVVRAAWVLATRGLIQVHGVAIEDYQIVA